MNYSAFLKISGAIALTTLLAACGGGADNSLANNVASTKTSLYSGSITGFGSVIVNGVRFSTTGASLEDNDAVKLSNTDLHIGTTVRVVGKSDDASGMGSASRVVVVHGVQGSISAIAAPELTVVGQRVVTNVKTAYENVANLAALAVGDKVEVYGPRQADGSVLATLIEKKALTGEALPGLVTNLDTVAKTFKINTLTVNYATAVVTGTLANGVSVKVKAASAPVAGVLTATKVIVHTDDDLSASGVDLIKIKGIASSAPVAGIVTVSGTKVDVSNAVYKGGTAIVAGSYIEVRGTMSGTTLIANLVEFEGEREARIGGSHELYGLISTFTSISNFVVNGVTVDASKARLTGTLGGLVAGAYIEVKGNMVGNVFVATRVELKSPDAPTGGYFEVYGIVSNFVSMASFTVNGIPVNASTAVVEHLERGAIANGRLIEMKGTKNASGVFIATHIEVK